ncbi:hypothetical protein [Mycoavidus sp. B2-EB]|uniref:hypothetical protein n=1 Tax=Mycoavidus sp. B2-EB TaxID=2651972 RepID=UPI00162A6889|nr:hypothetical protein [Mycoavidus sp. B2-EB]BBO59960.1 hypothetical protein MPB2EB_1091 [Mycoavidus sp. B2-EB]
MKLTPASLASDQSSATLVEQRSANEAPLSYSEKRIQNLQTELTNRLNLSFGKRSPSISSHPAFTPAKIVRPSDTAALPLETLAKASPHRPISAPPDPKRAGKLWPQWLSKLNLKKAVHALKQRAAKQEAGDWARSIENIIQPEQKLDADCLAHGHIDTVLQDLFPAAQKHETYQFLQSINAHLQKTQPPSAFLEPGLLAVAYELAQVCEGDLQQAQQVLVRLTQKLEINPTGTPVNAKLDGLAWRCAQAMAHKEGPALTALLKLQNLPRQKTGMFDTGPAAVLTVYLQASHLIHELLRSRNSALSVLPQHLTDPNTLSQLKQESKADLALLAIESARLTDLCLFFKKSPKEFLSRPQAAAFRLWQWGFHENQEGSELAQVTNRSYKAGTEWVTRANRYKKIRDEIAQTSIWSKQHWRARGKQIAKNLRNVIYHDKTPYWPNDKPLFGVDQKQIQEYNSALIDACQLPYTEGMNRLNMIQISQTPRRDSERTLFLNTALQVAQLEAWTEQSISSQTKQELAHPKNYDLTTHASRTILKKATRLIENQANRLPATEIKALLEMLNEKMGTLKRRRFFRLRSTASKSAPFDLNALKKISEEFFSNKDEENSLDKYGLKDMQRSWNDRIEKIEKLAPIMTPALDEITHETLHRREQVFMEQHPPGNSRQTSNGGRTGLNLGLQIGLGVNVIPSLKATHSRQAAYKIGSTEASRSITFGAPKQVTSYAGVTVFTGLTLIKTPILNIIAGVGAGGGPIAQHTRGYNAEISTLRPVPSRSTLSSEDSEQEWRKNSKEMVNLYWESIKHATDAQDYLEYFASECFYKNPNITLGKQKIKQTELGLLTGVFAGTQLDAHQPIRVGTTLALFNETVLYERRTVQSEQHYSQEKTLGWRNKTMLMQSASAALAGIEVHTESNLTLAPRSKALLPSHTYYSSQHGRRSIVHTVRDEQGLIPELMFRDVMFLNPQDLKRHAKQHWAKIHDQETLNNFFNLEKGPDAQQISGERWLIKPEVAAQLDEYANLATVLQQEKQALKLKKQKAANNDQKYSLQAPIRKLKHQIKALERQVEALLEAGASWKPYGLYSQGQKVNHSSPGWKYGFVATPESSQTGVSDVQWLLAQPAKNNGSHSAQDR